MRCALEAQWRGDRGCTWQDLLAESDVVQAVMEGSLAKADDVCGC